MAVALTDECCLTDCASRAPRSAAERRQVQALVGRRIGAALIARNSLLEHEWEIDSMLNGTRIGGVFEFTVGYVIVTDMYIASSIER